MKILAIGTLAALAMLAGINPASAADDKDASATVKTVWVEGKGQGSMADKAKQGWKFMDLDIYVEDGDMKGFFVTYVREPAPTP